MALMAVLESDLRALSAEARRRYPTVKDSAEHAILKLRSLSGPSEIANNEDILRIFLMACEVRSVKLSILGLSCLQNLISHDAVAPLALKDVLSTLKDHCEMNDETVQLKTLQTILIILQSQLHPENEEDMAQALGLCLRLLENHRSSENVRSTAAATFRQAVALIFDRVVVAERLPASKSVVGGQIVRTSSVTGDVSRNINFLESVEQEFSSAKLSLEKQTLSKTGKLGIRLLEDLTALAAGGSAIRLHVVSLPRIFSLEILDLREIWGSLHTVDWCCDKLLMLSGFTVLRLSLNVRNPNNTNVGEGIVKALARVVSNVQVPLVPRTILALLNCIGTDEQCGDSFATYLVKDEGITCPPTMTAVASLDIHRHKYSGCQYYGI